MESGSAGGEFRQCGKLAIGDAMFLVRPAELYRVAHRQRPVLAAEDFRVTRAPAGRISLDLSVVLRAQRQRVAAAIYHLNRGVGIFLQAALLLIAGATKENHVSRLVGIGGADLRRGELPANEDFLAVS